MLLRAASLFCFAAGGLLLSMGLDAPAAAVTCDGIDEVSPATCKEAHEVLPGQDPDGRGCALIGGSCTAEPDSLCTGGWSMAVKGKCEAAFGGSNVGTCIEDYGTTIVEIFKYDASCGNDKDGDCTCINTKTDPINDKAMVQVCDCYEYL